MAKKGGNGGLTPMMKQYTSIRKTLPEDVLLFFRLGDFYELFLEDAKEAAGLLDVALTKRNGMYMCGVPHHAAEGYIGKLIKAGKRVAIAEQTTEPVPGKIVEREVAQIISAGTVSDLNLLEQGRPNFLASVTFAKRRYGLAVIDHTTGDFKVTEVENEQSLEDEIKRLQPSELLFSEEQEDRFGDLRAAQSYDSYAFLHEPAEHLLLEHFGVQSLDGFGCGDMHAGICAAGAVLHYIRYQMRRKVGHLKRLHAWQSGQFVLIDAASQENLDLVSSRAGAKHSLLAAMDRTGTPMGARKLRDWILHPLRDISALEARQDLIAALLAEPFLLAKIRESLSSVRDVERILGRLSQGMGNARDMQALKVSLVEVPELKEHLMALRSESVPLLTVGEPGSDDERAFIDREISVEKRTGHSLPHWEQRGATYAVTFRLADSLPQVVLDEYLLEKKRLRFLFEKAQKGNEGELCQRIREQQRELYAEKIEKQLDAGQGECHLKNAKIAKIVADALGHFDGDRYQLDAWCLMPNHVHVVFRPLDGYPLEDILHGWKSFTAKEANKVLGKTGDFWQQESYDRLIRDGEEWEAQIEYVLKNPIRAGLEPWEWVKDERGGPAGGQERDALATIAGQLTEFPELVEMLDKALVDEPPAALKEGGILRDGFRVELDELRAASRDGKQWIAELQQREAERTGIKSLKVKFNNVFGYFIEITKSNLANVPDDYTRKQTTTNAERYITPELKEVENKILGADERARQLEYEEFLNLRESVIEQLETLQSTANTVATLDVLCGLSETARLYNYCRPVLNENTRLSIKDGRHPVLDQNIAEEKFVPNDSMLDCERSRLILLTGPNMAGKSTYIRQVALITLMAQTGSFVPAASAEIGIVDRIFTRVGANDDIARGQSTFMVEMNETAAIVNNATERSLVILDEIGRGTATFDGLSIAWSVAEHLHDRIGCRTLFATHYHELTALAKSRPTVENWNVAVREWNDRIIFLRKIVPGAADKSYGIQVARLAGLPKEILDRAKDILNHLETNAVKPVNKKKKAKSKANADTGKEDVKPDSASPQMTLFG